MPSPITSEGFNLAVGPSYAPMDPRLFVNDRSAFFRGVGNGVDLIGNIATIGPTVAGQNALALSRVLQAQSDLSTVHALTDAKLADLQAEKKKANLAQKLLDDKQAQHDAYAIALQQHPDLGNIPVSALQGMGGGQQMPFAGAQPLSFSGSPAAPDDGAFTMAAQPPGQAPPALGDIAVGAAQGSPDMGMRLQRPQAGIAVSRTGTSGGKSQIEAILKVPMTPAQAADIAESLRAYQANPVAQAQVAKVFSQLGDDMAHGNYWDAMANLRNAEAQNLIKTGGRSGMTNLILQNFTKAGGNMMKVLDWPAYNQAVADSVANGGSADDVRPGDFIDMDALAAENDRLDKLKTAKTPEGALVAQWQKLLPVGKKVSDYQIGTDADGNPIYDIQKMNADSLGNVKATSEARAAGGNAYLSTLLGEPDGTPTPAAPPPATAPAARGAPSAGMKFGKRSDGTYGLIPSQ